MLNAVIRFSLRQPILIIALAVLLVIIGLQQSRQLPIDVFPDLNRPRVVIITEAPGLAPEEVEKLINIRLEPVLTGATGVEDVRSSAGIGVSVIFVEFDWGTDIYIARQIVNERLEMAKERLPEGVQPQLAPISSIMGQIMLVGMYVDEGPELRVEGRGPADVDASHPPLATRPSSDRQPSTLDPQPSTSLLELRQLADWTVRRRLMNVNGVAQVFAMGGERGGKRQVQVLVNPDELRRLGVTLHQVETALAQANENATGGYVQLGSRVLLVRSLGRIDTEVVERADGRRDVQAKISDLDSLVVDGERNPPVLLHQVARVVNGPELPVGVAAVNGRPAVMLVITKQPGADTRRVTEDVLAALDELQPRLPNDVQINSDVYQMESFIDRAIDNVMEALRDGGILVVIILFVFLLNFRTTFITLTAIPLSIFITVLVFTGFNMSINTMTLGGLAVAIGELVDDAIVDVENIYRRLRENRKSANPRPALLVIYQASVEIRNSIVFGTMIVVLVFIPLFALHGMEGRLFTPLGIAYIVSILSSLLVSLTVTPVLSYVLFVRKWVWPCVSALVSLGLATVMSLWLLPSVTIWLRAPIVVLASLAFWGIMLFVDRGTEREKEGIVLRGLQWLAGHVIRFSMQFRWPVLFAVSAAALVSVVIVTNMGRNFLPPFNEGSVQISLFLPPETSLDESDRIAGQVDRALLALEDITQVGRRTGRAEEDEHVAGVNYSEIIVELDPDSPRSREEQLHLIREALDNVPGMESHSGRATTEQPISHLMSHMVSGVKAQLAIKIYGDDLAVLRNLAEEVRATIDGTPGVVDLSVEQQVLIPQLQIRPDRQKLALRGLTPGEVNHMVETAMKGRVMSEVLEGDATIDLVVRLDDRYRTDLEAIRDLALELPSGGSVPLSEVADVMPDRAGPNTINRENGRRRIVIQCNTSGRPLSEVRDEIQQRLAPLESRLREFGPGYHIEYGGQFESEQAATRLILVLSLVSLAGIFLVLYILFRSVNLSLQVMAALPMAAIGAVAALVITGQDLSVPNMVGFISLAGIASRNGILLITHYLHLVRYEGESFSQAMVIRAGKERVAPVLMTALTSGIGLVPLALAAGEPGKEILYPVATVIIGGLLSSTLLEFFVRPALFWTFGRTAANRLVQERDATLDFESAEKETDDLH